MEELNVVNDTQEQIVDAPEAAQDTGVESQIADAKPVQTAEENSKFAEVRRATAAEAEAKAKDAIIAEMYGESHGIKTYAEYKQALADAEQAEREAKFKEEHGVDPTTVKPLFEEWKQNDPDFQELSNIRKEKKINTALNELNSELKENGIDLQLKDLSDDEVKKIPNADKVTEYVAKGHSLADAFFLANKKDLLNKQAQTAQADTIRKIAANGASSPGLLSTGTTNDSELTPEMIEKMTPMELSKRWNEVKKVYKMS